MTRPLVPLAVALAVAGGLASCDPAFEPIAPSGRAFSMSGYLDGAADTQWVRVEALAPTIDEGDDLLDAEVTLESPDGTSTRFTQVTKRFRTGTAHLFWTTGEVTPGQTYAVVAQRSDGATTRAEVAVPDTVGVTVEVNDLENTCPAIVEIGGVEILADVQATYAEGDPAVRRARYSKLASVRETPDGFRATIYYGDDALQFGTSPFGFDGVQSEVRIAVGTEDWPVLEGLTLETALYQYVSDQIEGGVGFVGGTTSVTRPFRPTYRYIPTNPGDPRPREPCYSSQD